MTRIPDPPACFICHKPREETPPGDPLCVACRSDGDETSARRELRALGRRSGGTIRCRNPGCGWSTSAPSGGWSRFLAHAEEHRDAADADVELRVTVACRSCDGGGRALDGPSDVDVDVPCPDCDGEGSVGCGYCSGSGEGMADGTSCSSCRGGGEVACPSCDPEDPDAYEPPDRYEDDRDFDDAADAYERNLPGQG